MLIFIIYSWPLTPFKGEDSKIYDRRPIRQQRSIKAGGRVIAHRSADVWRVPAWGCGHALSSWGCCCFWGEVSLPFAQRATGGSALLVSHVASAQSLGEEFS